MAEVCGFTPSDSTPVIFGEGEVLENPTPALPAQRLGMGFEAGDARTYDVVIVGTGPAGSVKRVAPSAGEGSVVISEVWRHLNRH